MRSPDRALLKRAVTIQMVRIKIPSGASGAVEHYCELWPDVNPTWRKAFHSAWSALPGRPLRWVPADHLARGDRSEMERAVMGSVRVTSSCALSTLKSQGHETVKFGEVHWFGKKGERAVSESLFPRLHEQTP
jgi:hypothetical protein